MLRVYSVVRTPLDPTSLEASVQRIVAAMDKDIPVTQVRTMNGELMFSELAQPRFATVLLSTFAALAIRVDHCWSLRSDDLCGFKRRTREIGVRMALGAQRGTGTQIGVARRFDSAGNRNCHWHSDCSWPPLPSCKACFTELARGTRWCSWKSASRWQLPGSWRRISQHSAPPKSIPWWRFVTSKGDQ